MNTITSIYIPHVEKGYDPINLARLLDRLGIAKVSKIALEKYDKSNESHYNNFQKAYVEIKFWHDTEIAYNFIQRLKSPNVEARLVHSDDNWWAVSVNKFPHKTEFSNNLRTLTIFEQDEAVQSFERYDSDGSYDTDEDYDSDGEPIEWIPLPQMDQEVYHNSGQFITYLSAVSTRVRLMDDLIHTVGEKEYIKQLKRQNYRKWMDIDEVNPFDEIQEKADAKLVKMYMSEIDARDFDNYSRQIFDMMINDQIERENYWADF
jgi:hypothetical protein